ncbi:hypothetical protein MTO96_003920 [Rhipicephalus appendiculatus]
MVGPVFELVCGPSKRCTEYVRVFVSASVHRRACFRDLEGEGERAGGFLLGPRSSIIAEVVTRNSSLSQCRPARVFFLSTRRKKVRKLARMRHSSLAPPHLLRHVRNGTRTCSLYVGCSKCCMVVVVFVAAHSTPFEPQPTLTSEGTLSWARRALSSCPLACLRHSSADIYSRGRFLRKQDRTNLSTSL